MITYLLEIIENTGNYKELMKRVESIIYFAYNPKTKELEKCVLSLKDF